MKSNDYVIKPHKCKNHNRFCVFANKKPIEETSISCLFRIIYFPSTFINPYNMYMIIININHSRSSVVPLVVSTRVAQPVPPGKTCMYTTMPRSLLHLDCVECVRRVRNEHDDMTATSQQRKSNKNQIKCDRVKLTQSSVCAHSEQSTL